MGDVKEHMLSLVTEKILAKNADKSTFPACLAIIQENNLLKQKVGGCYRLFWLLSSNFIGKISPDMMGMTVHNTCLLFPLTCVAVNSSFGQDF